MCWLRSLISGGAPVQRIETTCRPDALLFVLPGEGFGLIGVYAVWLFVIVLLYPLCRRYDRYKSAHKEKWWLSYL